MWPRKEKKNIIISQRNTQLLEECNEIILICESLCDLYYTSMFLFNIPYPENHTKNYFLIYFQNSSIGHRHFRTFIYKDT